MTPANKIGKRKSKHKIHPVTARRVKSPQGCLRPRLDPSPSPPTHLLKLTSNPPWVVTAIQTLAVAANLMRRLKERIHHLEMNGCKTTHHILQRQGALVRDRLAEILHRKRAQWSAARQDRSVRMRQAVETNSVAHCREWAAW